MAVYGIYTVRHNKKGIREQLNRKEASGPGNWGNPPRPGQGEVVLAYALVVPWSTLIPAISTSCLAGHCKLLGIFSDSTLFAPYL